MRAVSVLFGFLFLQGENMNESICPDSSAVYEDIHELAPEPRSRASLCLGAFAPGMDSQMFAAAMVVIFVGWLGDLV